MDKDFDRWNEQKKVVSSKPCGPFYREQEIWWCKLGLNVGFEQDGKGKDYTRPVLIIRGFNLETCFVAGLTGRERVGRFYIPLGRINGREVSVVLSQLRIIDTKRLVKKTSALDDSKFEEICRTIQTVVFARK